MKHSILSLLLLFSIGLQTTQAQQLRPKISFETTKHDFGKIKEDGGNVTYRFEFRNTGSEPLIITNVKASCGCTSPKWTRKPVMPGSEGFVDVTYKPMGRPGRFSKSVSVTTNGQPTSITLHITGDVQPKKKTLADIYPYKIGDIRLNKMHISFGRIYNTQVKKQTIEIVNIAEQEVHIDFKRVGSHLDVKAVPGKLAPQQKGEIHITYDAKKRDDWDYVRDYFSVELNGKIQPQRLIISATIREDFSKLTKKDLEDAPNIEFETLVHDFGTAKKGDKIEYKFTFTNKGKDDLKIRKTRASCGCTATNIENDVIKSGESSAIKTVFNTAGRSGRQNKTITVITNDPKDPRIVLWLKGKVE